MSLSTQIDIPLKTRFASFNERADKVSLGFSRLQAPCPPCPFSRPPVRPSHNSPCFYKSHLPVLELDLGSIIHQHDLYRTAAHKNGTGSYSCHRRQHYHHHPVLLSRDSPSPRHHILVLSCFNDAEENHRGHYKTSCVAAHVSGHEQPPAHQGRCQHQGRHH